MEFLTRVLSGSSRLKERAREAEEVNQAFKENLDNLKRLLESEESDDVLALLDMVFESSFPEEQVFMKTPSRARLKSKKELVVRLLIGLDSLGVPAMAEMLVFIKKHGLEGVADSLLTLLDFLSPLLEGKVAPEFSTDDVVDAMDFEWHSSSRTGSPLLNVIASTTSSPRASTASIGDSPLHPIILASPYRRALSERAMLISRANELGAKSILDKTSTASTPPQQSQTISAMSASLQYPSANQDFRLNEQTILETPASPEITQVSTVVKPSSYSLDTHPESGLQRKHSRRSWSLRQLLVEDVIEELSGEGSVGASSKRNSSSSSWRQNSSEFTKIFTNTSETSSPMNPGLAADHNREGDTIAPDKTFLSSIFTQDRHVNSSSQKGSRRISPSPPLDEVALWREDSGGFSLDLVSSYKNAAQTSVDDAKHGIPLILHDLEAETCPSGVDVDALKPEEREIQLQSHGDVEEDARHAHSSHDHKEDARHAYLSSDHYDQDAHSLDTHEEDSGNAHTHVQSSSDHEEDVDSSYDSDEEAGHGHTNVEEDAVHAHTHEQDARHTFSLDTYDEDVDFEQDVWETASPKITPEDRSQEGHGFQWILAPLLLPSASNVSQDVNDQAGDISSFSLENDKDLNSMGGSSSDEREDKELHAALSPCEDLQTTQDEGDVKPSFSMQDQGQVNTQYGSHRDVLVQSYTTDITDDTPLSFTHGVNGMINDEDRAHLHSMSCNDAATLSHPDEDRAHLHFMSSNDAATLSHPDVIASPRNHAEAAEHLQELPSLDDQHPYYYVKADEHLQELPSLDALNMRDTFLTDCADINSKLHAPLFPESSPTLREAFLEEILQSKGGPSLMQQALKMKDDMSPGKEINRHKSSLDESLGTDLVNHSLNENIKLEMPELMREDENVQPLSVHVDNASRPCELEEHVNVTDDHFEKLLSELGSAEEDVLHKGGELPVINDIEGGQMGMHGDKQNPSNLQDVEPSFEKGMQEDLTAVYDVVSDTTSAGESTRFVHTYPVESHVVNSSKEDSMVCEEANSKLDQDKQYGLERPTMVHEALLEGEVSMPCSEASEVVDANGIYSLHGKDHIYHQSPVHISYAESAVKSTEPGHTDQLAVQFTDSGAQCELLTAQVAGYTDQLAVQLTDSGTQCELLTARVVDASESRTLQDVDDYIQPPAAHFTVAYTGSPLRISDYESASHSTKSGSAAQSTDTESAAQFTGSGMHNVPSTQVADTTESQPLHEDDYIQRPAAHLTEQYVGSLAAVNAANGDHMRVGFMASLKDHEHQNADHLYQTDPPAAEYTDLHGHPTSSSTLRDLDYQQRSDQNVLNEPATCNQPANRSDPTMDRWDSGTNMRRSKRKSSCMGKFTGGCLSCCWTKPHTNP